MTKYKRYTILPLQPHGFFYPEKKDKLKEEKWTKNTIK